MYQFHKQTCISFTLVSRMNFDFCQENFTEILILSKDLLEFILRYLKRDDKMVAELLFLQTMFEEKMPNIFNAHAHLHRAYRLL
jgi:hypothetical protein